MTPIKLLKLRLQRQVDFVRRDGAYGERKRRRRRIDYLVALRHLLLCELLLRSMMSGLVYYRSPIRPICAWASRYRSMSGCRVLARRFHERAARERAAARWWRRARGDGLSPSTFAGRRHGHLSFFRRSGVAVFCVVGVLRVCVVPATTRQSRKLRRFDRGATDHHQHQQSIPTTCDNMDDEEATCAICLEPAIKDATAQHNATVLPCGHIYHRAAALVDGFGVAQDAHNVDLKRLRRSVIRASAALRA